MGSARLRQLHRACCRFDRDSRQPEPRVLDRGSPEHHCAEPSHDSPRYALLVRRFERLSGCPDSARRLDGAKSLCPQLRGPACRCAGCRLARQLSRHTLAEQQLGRTESSRSSLYGAPLHNARRRLVQRIWRLAPQRTNESGASISWREFL